MNVRSFIAVLSAGVLMLCCKPSSMEFFASEPDGSGRWSFTLDMSDSTSVSDIYLLLSLGCDDQSFAALKGVPLDMEWVSPDSLLFSEKVWMGTEMLRGRSDFEKHLYAPYRTGIVPRTKGIWTLHVKPDTGGAADILGVGIKYGSR